MFDIDLIIPCYGKSELINRGVASLATSWKKEFIHVTLVNDCSPNTDCNYQDLVDRYKDFLDIRVIKTPENYGQGLTRQYGIDHTKHDWFMFMDEDDQYCPLAISQIVGAAESYGWHISPDGRVELDQNGRPVKDNVPDVAVVSAPLFEFDDNHTHVISSNNQIWLNAKLYNREFVKKHNVRFNFGEVVCSLPWLMIRITREFFLTMKDYIICGSQMKIHSLDVIRIMDLCFLDILWMAQLIYWNTWLLERAKSHRTKP